MKIGKFEVGILNLFLVFVPIAFVLHYSHADATWIFIISGLAIIPLAGILGEATEHLSEHVGPGVGGLLNATFGNAAELIIAIFALQAGLYGVVKASITGSIIGNITGLNFDTLQAFGIVVFPVVILGGLDSILGAVVAGIIMGLIQQFSSGYLDGRKRSGRTYTLALLRCGPSEREHRLMPSFSNASADT